MTTNLERLQDLLRELFQFDLADLDFGLYRLFHLKQAEIEAFIGEQLPREVEAAFGHVTAADREIAQRRVEELTAQVRQNLGEDALLPNGDVAEGYRATPLAQNHAQARRRLAAIQVSDAHKAEVFNHLVAFLGRYYEDGDFIPKRRYGVQEAYAVPYHGEEVFFHWANRDQHYVKTAERLRDYAFQVGDLLGQYRVRFTLTQASVARDNTKGAARYFFPRPDQAAYDREGRQLTLPCEYRLPTPAEAERYGANSRAQEAILQEALPAILQAVPEENLRSLLHLPSPSGRGAGGEGEGEPLLLRRLRHFCRRNTSDYFIHRDLRGFLRRELDFYIKDQVLHVLDLEADEIALDAKRRMLRAFRSLAGKLIDFLATIEDAQKALFEKRKFVLETDYLIPLQHVPRAFWPELLANEAQRQEWRAWHALEPAVDLLNPEGALDEAYLAAHPTLPVHTRHFPRETVRRLLEALPFADLDDATDGLLVHSENYQALNLLAERYREQVKCVYIDPPYNAAESEILYRNAYKHSSWASLMFTRLSVARAVQLPDGLICITIDDYELQHAKFIADEVFGADNHLANVVIRNNPSGRSTVAGFAVNHEYALFYANSIRSAHVGRLAHAEGQKARYDQVDESGRPFEWENLRKSSRGSLRNDRPRQFFPLYYNRTTAGLRIPLMEWKESTRSWEILEGPKDNERVLYPVDESGVERVWNYGVGRVVQEASQIKVVENGGRCEVYKPKYLRQEGMLPRTWWDKPAYSARDNGARALKDLFGQIGTFDFPKAVQAVADAIGICLGPTFPRDSNYVLDFFAGSGTTGHAVINLNREDGGRRRFILVEMGEYFDTVLVPRIAKVMYTPAWKEGKPQRPATPEEAARTPRLVKILRLESYDDALHNLAAPSTLERAAAFAGAYRALAGEEAYCLRYWLELPLRQAETCLRTLDLAHPFAYSLEILTDAGPQRKPVDLVETFNYLYGLRVRRCETWRHAEGGGREYRAVHASDREGKRRILVLWRDMEGLSPERERAFLEGRIAAMQAQGETWDEILINGDSPTPGVASLDPLFKRLMMQGEGA